MSFSDCACDPEFERTGAFALFNACECQSFYERAGMFTQSAA